MQEQRFFWYLDPTVLRQVRIPEFGWFEFGLLVVAFAGLAAYLIAARYLDRSITWRAKRGTKEAELRRKLEPAALDAEDWNGLHALARTRRDSKLFDFLAEPVGFELRVHEAQESGEADGFRFLPKVREHLGYRSDNFLVPLVSTRQLLPGDSVRVSPRDPARPSHHYGEVESVDSGSFTVRLGGTGLDPAESRQSNLDLFVMRGEDLEHRFDFIPAGGARTPARVVLRHVLADLDMRPRQIRLPLLLEVAYEERAAHRRDIDALDPDLAPGPPGKAVLYDLSDGGFALVTAQPHAEGKFLRLNVPLRRAGRYLDLQGRVAACRPLRGGHYMVHATLRGLSQEQRHTLNQVVHHEQTRRQKTLARIQPRKAR